MDMEELIWKLIDITDIKKEYLKELNELLDEEAAVLNAAMEKEESSMSDMTAMSFTDTQESMHKIQRMLMNLDEEFLTSMNELKEEGDVISIAELDGHRYTRLRDLQKIVEGVMHLETLYEIKRKDVHDLKSRWIERCRQTGHASHIGIQGNGRASEMYRKAQARTP